MATTAFGKTVIAAWLISQRKVNTLVLVHRRQLLEQWVQRLATFLNLPPKSIGQIGGGRRTPTGMLDVALIQSLSRKGVVQNLVGDYGHVMVDECHHLSAASFEQVIRQAKAKFITGLTDARTCCCDNTATLSSGFLPKTSARNSITCWIRFFASCRTVCTVTTVSNCRTETESNN